MKVIDTNVDLWLLHADPGGSSQGGQCGAFNFDGTRSCGLKPRHNGYHQERQGISISWPRRKDDFGPDGKPKLKAQRRRNPQ